MKPYLPILVVLLLVSTSFVGVCNQVEKFLGNKYLIEESEFLTNGHIAYTYIASLGPYGEGSYKFNTSVPGDVELLGKNTMLNFPSGGTWVNENGWFVVEYHNGALYKIDNETGKIFEIGGGGTGLGDIAWDDVTGKLYGTSSYDLWEIDLDTGEKSLIGNLNISALISGIACDNKGNCYGVGFNSTNFSLYAIDLFTGETTLVCSLTNCTSVGEAAYDKENDVLYLLTFDELFVCDTETGECTLIGPTVGEYTGFAIPYTLSNHPPNPPIIEGPTCGKTGELHIYTFNSTDDDEDNLSYFIKWGDGNTTGWIGPYPSGFEISMSYAWDAKGTYNVSARAMDKYGTKSDWATLDVTMPKSYNPVWWLNNLLNRFPLLQRLLEWLMW